MAVKQNDIRIGSRENPFLSLDNSDIISVNGNLACDLLCEKIPIDTLEIQCRYDRMHRVFAPSDYDGLITADGAAMYARDDVSASVPEIPYATGLWYLHGGRYVGKFYVTGAQRTGKAVYTITAQSAMGVLGGLTYYGKSYLNAALPEVLEDILLTDGLQDTKTPFLTALHGSLVLGEGLDTATVTGWIPVCTKREALHHVLFALGLNIFKAENDAFLISRVSAAVAGRIEDADAFDGGSVELTQRVKLVEVTEHSYIPNLNAEEKVLYDNTEGGLDTTRVVIFDDAPIIPSSITATGSIQIKAVCENCALVSGIGTIVGKPYSHTAQTIRRENGAVYDGETVSVTDATLVNSLISNAVADRVYAYYTQRRAANLPIVLQSERCGILYSCPNPYGERADAYITDMRITASAIARAECIMVAGYVPPKTGGEFSHMVLLTGSGTFTVPEEVLSADSPRIRFVLIGGGSGGHGGASGESGHSGIITYATSLAKPGAPGANGTPGKILAVQFEGEAILSAYRYSCGRGGGGGGSDDDYGPFSGGPTYLSNPSSGSKLASSDNGAVSNSGYLDILSGSIYGGASPDFSHLRSGRGGGAAFYSSDSDGEELLPTTYGDSFYAERGYYVVNRAISAKTGAKIGSVASADGGFGGDGHAHDGLLTNDEYFPEYYDGFGGGGPITAATQNPESCNGGKTIIDGTEITIGNGGKGAPGTDAPSPFELNPTAYGQGGIGGLGGGGGGSAGALNENYDWSGYTIKLAFGGAGGDGGKGSAGAPGCILVYY